MEILILGWSSNPYQVELSVEFVDSKYLRNQSGWYIWLGEITIGTCVCMDWGAMISTRMPDSVRVKTLLVWCSGWSNVTLLGCTTVSYSTGRSSSNAPVITDGSIMYPLTSCHWDGSDNPTASSEEGSTRICGFPSICAASNTNCPPAGSMMEKIWLLLRIHSGDWSQSTSFEQLIVGVGASAQWLAAIRYPTSPR